ncbi:ParA family protein [Glaciecola petra]|uniref:ParA family protein n=1 Tax=Glaciecola petra TaxID=3075602 RepID=A0ABU2ZMI8_9ALTE|nr:ParA family protein [Aestuariibacter sp. P117]MDT0593830.1 ParA family protein [Aestuariibacter sp. P117]
MKVWSLVNQKGGVGKTTSTISIAACLSALGKRVLLIDLDPQSSLSYYLGIDSDTLQHTLFDVFTSPQNTVKLKAIVNKVTVQTSIQNVTLLPSHMALSTIDNALSQQTGKGLIIKNALDCISSDYDYVLIDCPPVLGVLMINAITSSDKLILPTQTEYLAFQGLQRMMSTLEKLRTNLKQDARILIVPTLFDRRYNAAIRTYSLIRETFKESLWKGYIPIDTKFRDASAIGASIVEVAPESRGAFAYEKLTNDLLKHE